MDYFKSLGSAASSVLASARSGPLPNFTIGQELIEYRSQTIWSLYSAVKRDDSTPCTVLAFDLSQPHNAARSNLLQPAKNAARKLRTTRHPDILKLLDSAETDTSVYIVVEKATPLYTVLAQTHDSRSTTQRQDWITWGLSSVVNAVKFLNIQAASTHGNIRPHSIFICASGQWKLAGFEILTSHLEAPHGLLYTHASFLPDAARYVPPEVKKNGWNALASMDSTVLDSYSLALVAIEAFNGILPPQSGTPPPPPRGHVPQPLYAMLQRMLVPNAKNRMAVAKLHQAGEADGGFFKENTLVKVARGLDGFLLATENEKSSIIKLIQEKPDCFMPDFLMYKVLPALVNALSSTPPPGMIPSASTQASTLLPLVLRLGQPLPKHEWNAIIVPPLLKAYASPDRSTRMVLLENLSLYADRMENRVVIDKLWPNLISGFNDSVPVIREATLKAILPLAPKLTDRILNNDLLRLLARMQVDPEAGIRTNTTILLGRLVSHLSLSTRKKVLIPAFARSLKDPFVHARVAGLMALMATGDSFDHEDAARHVLPAVSPCMVDKEKLVRDQADKAVEMFLEIVQKRRADMPDTVLRPDQLHASSDARIGADGMDGSAGYASSMAASAGSAATALAGWAMSSALSSLSKSTTNPAVTDGKSLSSAAELQSNMDIRSPSSTSLGTSASAAPPPTTSGLASFKLGSGTRGDNDLSSSSFDSPQVPATKSALDYDLNDDAAASTSTASAFAMQSDKDLMDVHDDSADWSSFEVGQPKKKAIAVGQTKMARAKLGPRRTPTAQSQLGMMAASLSADAKHAISRNSLQVVSTRIATTDAEEMAWGDSLEKEAAEEKTEKGTAENVAAADVSCSCLAAASANRVDSMSASQELTIQAFEAPIRSPIEGNSAAASRTASPAHARVSESAADTWATFEDGDDEDEEQKSKPAPRAARVVAPPMTKEEKKAELERKRQERRLRLEQLKKEKEEARLRALQA